MNYLSKYIEEKVKKQQNIKKENDNPMLEEVCEPYEHKSNSDFIPLTISPFERKKDDPELIAFYLPQYHRIKENDEWWGRGFTEWTNVTRATPQFDGHYQPHLPIDLGFYDLSDTSVMARQVELARMYGIYGFCFYYYWFSGKKLLEKPLENYLSAPHINFPFCLCWANENWTRRWDGAQDMVLMEQKYRDEDIVNFVSDIAPYLCDSRYIQIHGAPALIIYANSRIPYAKEFVRRLRECFQESGFEKVWLVAALSYEFFDADVREYGYDAAVEFPMFGLSLKTIEHDSIPGINPDFKGAVRHYPEILASRQHLRENSVQADAFFYRTALVNFDNTARRMENAVIVADSSPELYKMWLDDIIFDAKSRKSSDNIVFIHAWNEWAEGSHLEPDRRYGYSYLSATKEALLSARRVNIVSVICLVNKTGTLDDKTCVSLRSLKYKNKQLVIVYTDAEDNVVDDKVEETLRESYPCGIVSITLSDFAENEVINKALGFTSGQYIMIVNNGDYFEPSRVDVLIETAKNTKAHFVFSQIADPCDESETTRVLYDAMSESALLMAVLKSDISGGAGNFFFSRTLLEKIGGFEPYADLYSYDFLLRSCFHFSIAYTRETKLFTKQRRNDEQYSDTIRIYGKLRGMLKRHQFTNPIIGKISDLMCDYLAFYCEGDYTSILRYETAKPELPDRIVVVDGNLECIRQKERFVYYVRGWCILNHHDSNNSAIYLCLTSETREHYYNLPSVSRSDVNQSKGDLRNNYCNSGFDAFICTYGLPAGRYGVSLVAVSSEGVYGQVVIESGSLSVC